MSLQPSQNPEDVTELGFRRCYARSSQTGNRCGNPAMQGQRVCRNHGGGTQASLRKARLRMAELVDPAIGVLARILADPHAKPGDRIRAAENVLDRAGIVRRNELDPEMAREILADRLVQMLAEQAASDVIEGEVVEGPEG